MYPWGPEESPTVDCPGSLELANEDRIVTYHQDDIRSCSRFIGTLIATRKKDRILERIDLLETLVPEEYIRVEGIPSWLELWIGTRWIERVKKD